MPDFPNIDGKVQKLVNSRIIYEGKTTAAGGVDGKSIIDTNITEMPGIINASVILWGSQAIGQSRPVRYTDYYTSEVYVTFPFYDKDWNPYQVPAGTKFMLVASDNVQSEQDDTADNETVFAIHGNKYDTARHFASIYSTRAMVKGVLNYLWESRRQLQDGYNELWLDSGPPNASWSVTNPATGTAWTRESFAGQRMQGVIPNANENARLRLLRDFVIPYEGSPIQSTYLMFGLNVALDANIDKGVSFFGLTPGVNDNRTSNGVVGFYLDSNYIYAVYDKGGVEQTYQLAQISGSIIYLGVEVSSNFIDVFYATGRVKRFTRTPGIVEPMYPNFYIATLGTGAARLRIGPVRILNSERLVDIFGPSP